MPLGQASRCRCAESWRKETLPDATPRAVCEAAGAFIPRAAIADAQLESPRKLMQPDHTAALHITARGGMLNPLSKAWLSSDFKAPGLCVLHYQTG